ncbi:hypothetical protein CBQ26_09260 [Deinococcus indicus]|uniref:Uncharacterized protein n=1 Tax=Deinococcus indicus TaxID=223556 RepID=A0A2D0A828_9DEIO|nr:hypothetical protein [Deinococcus indicus]OWL96555.1 hypothetical protein CBQ26_09260 [Deinococcus indicus]
MTRPDKLTATGKRRRASGDGGNSQRFAKVRMPDGREAKIPAAKDASTYICLETPEGRWPDKAAIVLLYDVTWLVEDSTFELEEMRPGHGMGTMRTYRVIQTRARIQLHEGCYGQVQRWLLCEELTDLDTRMGMSADDLLADGA